MEYRDWERFADLLEKIMAMEGTWQEKATVMTEKLEETKAIDNWNEIVHWFAS